VPYLNSPKESNPKRDHKEQWNRNNQNYIPWPRNKHTSAHTHKLLLQVKTSTFTPNLNFAFPRAIYCYVLATPYLRYISYISYLERVMQSREPKKVLQKKAITTPEMRFRMRETVIPKVYSNPFHEGSSREMRVRNT